MVNSDTTVDAICAEWGVPAIEGGYDAAFAALATVESIKRHEKNYDAFIIACYSDPGLYAARELTNKPVYGIAQASMLAACSFGHRFSILSPLARFKPVLESIVRSCSQNVFAFQRRNSPAMLARTRAAPARAR